ncbi:MAG: BRO family protein [Sphingobacteriales bacterium]
MKNDVRLFEQQKVRTHWDEKAEKWYFSIVDVISILTDQPHHQGARNYWKVLKSRLLKEGNETVTNCNRLKLVAEDGKLRLTDAADTEQLLRLIQSIPSPKAEPFKQWLAKTGYERMKEIADPEQSLDRARENWQKLGRSAVNTREKIKGEVRRAGASHFSLYLLP